MPIKNAKSGGGGGGGGVTDHGALTGLSDDDHSQYHNNARGDARYYTQGQVDTALAGKADTAHTHVLADVTDAGSSASRDVAPSGNASSAQVVKGDDTRLTDSRSPTAHTHAASEITDFHDEVSANADVEANTAARHEHVNFSILEDITDAFTTDDRTKLDGIEDGATADQTAAEVPVTPAGNLASSDAQAALEELQGDIDSINSSLGGLTDAVVLKGAWDASAGTFPAAGAAQAGWSYIVSVGGTVDGVVFVANDRLLAIVDNASATIYAANWHKLDYTDQVLSVAGQTGAVTLDTDDVTEAANLYFTDTRAKTAAVLNTLAGSETDQAPSVSAVNTALATKAASSHTHAAGDTTSGTFADARISQSSVTQHQAALAITESQISDLKHTAAVGGALSLVSGKPSYVADQNTKSTLYYTPYYSNTVAIWSGSAWVNREFSEISLALSSLTSGKNYDVFLNWSGSAVALSLGTAWTNDTTRATALATQNGISVKSGDAGYRYVGTIRTSGTTTTDDSATSRFLYNHYNAIKKPSLTGYRVHFDAYSLVVGDETPLHIIGEAYVQTTEGTAATHTTAQELTTQQRVTFTLTETRNVYATAKAEGDTATAGNAAVLLVDPSTGTPEEYARYVNPGGLGFYGTIFGKKKYTLAAGTYTFKLMFRCTAAQQARFQNRILEIALA